MRIFCIFLNGQFCNLYINTGYYAHKVAKEISEKTQTQVVVKEYDTELTFDILQNFIESKGNLTKTNLYETKKVSKKDYWKEFHSDISWEEFNKKYQECPYCYNYVDDDCLCYTR